jgi:hypothetical protein
MTTSGPAGNEERRSKQTARRRRRTRLRTTAPPTALVTMKPNRAWPPSRRTTWMTVFGVPTLRPRRTAARKSAGRVTRFDLASTCVSLSRYYADSSVRPLRRRAARIARPARVRMRSRKPWTLARRRLFGWKVLLLMVIAPKPSFEGRKEVGGPEAGSQLIKSTALIGCGQTFAPLLTLST